MDTVVKLNNIFSGLPKNKKSKVLGRGIGCGKGKTSGRGHKGQKARSGVSINGFEGGQQSIFTRLPKRGFNSLLKHRYSIVNLSTIQRLIDSKKIEDVSAITKEVLYNLGVISSIKEKIKILGNGKLNTAVAIEYDFISKSAESQVTLLSNVSASKE
ncbi:ribosomal protein L15 [Ehrlichia chaffeensis str. Liberty]|uniref:Large ribosomal subunit protein uL15 n=1 Tax=Ehrlichia chaffeensis (strain ATCC CRL-10679 / Arkansas) TaxID=205920 RepID=RL15_EHRCR|nr:50S ribosomal protein L15 [Ehrlichia chaffeensis]Q2GH38.1 RecName: Full=Large ribosomal subunit protein uL15; AltName: Full=50S ribosomal protein L15 [Ehrlichia chaffeensis str. Arkansas]ABD45172.1 ribosomal protein L15 [Ehrlichia chaffeensis str. Arkansas]AHX05750.1 ribosomal protein L15 [Ehrlichia chaffeensis str. Jax]AHX06742.1 ribosomal protein L15 [Ehrlichia chaffeensis str. Liberty]AHX07091.1 ribosomal protein L15 [Ehrlichia chaffeensis str. Osceola]AHX08310.1 ribosomal protein L15 [